MSGILCHYNIICHGVQNNNGQNETSQDWPRFEFHVPALDCASDSKMTQGQHFEERKCWIINILLDILVGSISVHFYPSFVF